MDKATAVADLTDLLAKFTAHIGKRLPTDVTQKLGELREKEGVTRRQGDYRSLKESR